MMNILLTGSNGQLGQSIIKQNNFNNMLEIDAYDVEELDITNRDQIHEVLSKKAYDVLINCAAYTNVDGAENNAEAANKVNGVAVGLLAEECKIFGTMLVHISTDYVFDGTSKADYMETSAPNPLNIYGSSKLAGERLIARSGVNAYIIRTSWLYSEFGNNFVKTMLDLGKKGKDLRIIDDQIGSPTYAGDLAKAILYLVKNRKSKGVTIFHITNGGATSWYNLAKQSFMEAEISGKITPVTTETYGSPTPRPMRSVLDNHRFESLMGFKMPLWQKGLESCIKELSKS